MKILKIDFYDVITNELYCVLDERKAEVLYLSARKLPDGFKLILSLSKQINVSFTSLQFILQVMV